MGASVTGAVHLERVSFTYPDGRQALSRIDLDVQSGERVAVLGPNGAGKTTLMLHLNGILAATDGSVTVGGLELTRGAGRDTLREVRRRVGIVFQDPDDQLFMPTVAQDVAFGPANFGVTGAALEERVREALGAVDMAAHAERNPAHLSVGQRRRVALATVLACTPDVLVLDEPSSNLDPVARRELAEVLTGIDTTLLLVTHDLPYAAQLCTRAVILDGGHIVADGPIRELLGDTDLLAAHRLELPWGFLLPRTDR
ncbi:MAG: ABC transporter ATP-binding protein [Rhodococcus sp. (in: high G+C Gram-positive bacteria)]|uniref:energy-coupling factor ABC transporter ATP-binding protein n=1 Tax=Rhodococcus sp. TaxID=1831 RepID=UPI003BAF1F4C